MAKLLSRLRGGRIHAAEKASYAVATKGDYILIQVLAGPPVVVRPAGKLANQVPPKPHRFSQLHEGHASWSRLQSVISPFTVRRRANAPDAPRGFSPLAVRKSSVRSPSPTPKSKGSRTAACSSDTPSRVTPPASQSASTPACSRVYLDHPREDPDIMLPPFAVVEDQHVAVG